MGFCCCATLRSVETCTAFTTLSKPDKLNKLLILLPVEISYLFSCIPLRILQEVNSLVDFFLIDYLSN